MNFTINFDRRTIIIALLIFLLLLLGAYHFKSIGDKNEEILREKKLHNALSDSIKTYQNKENEWVSEKLTIQAETKDLKDKNIKLSANQSELIKRVDAISKHNQVITAALIDMGVKLDGLINDKPTFENDSTLTFSSPKSDTTLLYDVKVHNVKQFGLLKPSLELTKFSIPNKQFIEFHWKNDKKEGYPISFTVTNTNPYYKVYDLDSYAIPELDKTKVKPTFWNKLGDFSKTWGGRAIFFGAGILIGGAVIK